MAHIPTGGLAVGWSALAAPAGARAVGPRRLPAHPGCAAACMGRDCQEGGDAPRKATVYERRRAMAKAHGHVEGDKHDGEHDEERPRVAEHAPARERQPAAPRAARRPIHAWGAGGRQESPRGGASGSGRDAAKGDAGTRWGRDSASSAQSYERRGAKPRAACRMIPRSRSRVEVESAARAHASGAAAWNDGCTAFGGRARARMRGRPAGRPSRWLYLAGRNRQGGQRIGAARRVSAARGGVDGAAGRRAGSHAAAWGGG